MEYQDTASSIDRKFTFNDAEIGAVQNGLSLGLYNTEEDRSVRQEKWRTLFNNMCLAFGMTGYRLEFTGDSERGAGSFDRSSKTVYMGSRFSLTTLLHHFLLALADARSSDAAFTGMLGATGMSNRELIAAFSLSLFREAAPEMYEKAKLDGKLLYFKQEEERERKEERRRRMAEDGQSHSDREECSECGCVDCECDNEPEPMPGTLTPDIDPENRVDRGNGLGED